jgi:hypothetical protein
MNFETLKIVNINHQSTFSIFSYKAIINSINSASPFLFLIHCVNCFFVTSSKFDLICFQCRRNRCIRTTRMANFNELSPLALAIASRRSKASRRIIQVALLRACSKTFCSPLLIVTFLSIASSRSFFFLLCIVPQLGKCDYQIEKERYLKASRSLEMSYAGEILLFSHPREPGVDPHEWWIQAVSYLTEWQLRS